MVPNLPWNWTVFYLYSFSLCHRINIIPREEWGISKQGFQVGTIRRYWALNLFRTIPWTGPAVTIVNDRNVSTGEAVFKSGALIRLVCLVHQAHDENFVLNWTHGKFTLNRDTQRGGVRYWWPPLSTSSFITWFLMVRLPKRADREARCRCHQLASHFASDDSRRRHLHVYYQQQSIASRCFCPRHSRCLVLSFTFSSRIDPTNIHGCSDII